MLPLFVIGSLPTVFAVPGQQSEPLSRYIVHRG